jgi:hypothetical protein
MNKKIIKPENLILLISIVIYIAYGCLYISQTYFTIEGKNYFVLFDDEMISMRFAKNIADGNGPVWNVGENPRVEGYSNPLWMLYMTIPHLLKIPINYTSLFIQLTALVLVIINLIQVWVISRKLYPGNLIITGGALLFNIFYLPFLAWTLLGTEVSLLIVLFNMSVIISFRNFTENRFSIYQILPAAIAMFVRMDAAVVFIALSTFLYIAGKEHRRKILLSGLILFIGINGIILLIRYYYYGEIFPNTYFLKMTGFPFYYRIIKGILVAGKFIFFFNFIFFLLSFYFAFKEKRKIFYLIPILFAAQIFYSIYVGGDAWEWWGGANRYISVLIPAFFIMVSVAMYKSVTVTIEYLKEKKVVNLVKYQPVLLIVAFSACLFNMNCMNGKFTFRELYFKIKPFTVVFNQKQLETALLLGKIAKKEASVAVVAAGTVPYFSGLKTYDLLGKNDKFIARTKANKIPNKISLREFIPGHNKWDYSYTIGKLKPDIVLNLWYNPVTAVPYIKENYLLKKYKDYYIIFKKDTKNIRLELLRYLPDGNYYDCMYYFE